MPENLFIPSVDLRIGALEEYNRVRKLKAAQSYKKKRLQPCVTISRQYGCEGYPVAELIVKTMTEKTGEPWLLIDKDVLDEVSRHHNISKEILENLGEKKRRIDDILAVFSPRWTHSQDCFQLLCHYVVSLAEQGNVVIMEMGGATITRHFEHARHFRIYASEEFKAKTIARRLKINVEEAAEKITTEQRKRDNFAKDFLSQSDHDPLLYDIMFNNDRLTPEQMAGQVVNYLQIA